MISKLIGLDVGYGFVKVGDEKAGYSFPSVVGDGQIVPGFNRYKNKSNVEKLTIEWDGALYFVGKQAIRRSRYVTRDLSYNRSSSSSFETLFFSALSLLCDKLNNRFKVVTGLPVDQMHYAKEIVNRVQGERDIKVFTGQDATTFTIDVEDIEVVPQPFGGYCSEYPPLNDANAEEGKIGVIDIGFRTTDLALINEGEFIPEKSMTIPVGLATAYRNIRYEIGASYNLEKESYELDEAIIKKQIIYDGNKEDISGLLDGMFAKLATTILVDVNSVWGVRDLKQVLICGGGGQHLESHIKAQIEQSRLVPDPVEANCVGYLNWAKRIWEV